MPVLISLLLVALLGFGCPGTSRAQGTTENAEARVYFEEGNRLYQQAARASGAERTTLLQRSLEAYVDSLRIVRSRNALFNAAIVLGELERHAESFNYFTEYLQIPDLPEADREDATRRRDALRKSIAVLHVFTEPEGARVWIDRKDLAPRGQTPLEVALPPGAHRLFIERDGFLPTEESRNLITGETVVVTLTLEDEPLPPPPVEPVEPEPEPFEEKRPRLRNAAIGTAAATFATAMTGLGLSLKARSLRNDYDQAAEQYRLSGDPEDFQRAQDLADRTDRFNIAADVMWGTTIALGVSALVLYGVHRKRQKRERPEVSISVSRQGGFASVKMPFGAGP